MSVEINWLAVLLATVSSMFVGGFWYGDAGFGKPWRKLLGTDKIKMTPEMKREFNMSLVKAFLTAGLMAYVLAHVIYLSHSFYLNSWLQDSLTTALWMWLGFQLTRTIMRDAFELRRKKLTLINTGNDLATIMVMGLIIGLFKI
jgi:cation transport ATPase